MKENLTFGDVLLKPKYSEIKSRSQIDLSVSIGNFKFSNPIIPANMKSLVSEKLCEEVYKNKSLCFLHRFMSIDDQLNIFKSLKDKFGQDVFNYIGCSVGVKEEDKENSIKLINLGLKIFCIDIAHGHSKDCGDMCFYLKNLNKDILLIAGNVATSFGAEYLWSAGADIVKVGVGSGAICTTRLKAGAGVPQLEAIKTVYDVLPKNKYIISDGGIRQVGDFVKALGFSHMVMCGNMFSGCEESPEDLIEIDGRKYKKYAGSSTHKNSNIEGVISLVNPKGKFKDLVDEYSQGIKSGLSYTGACNLSEFKKLATFVRITNSSVEESHAHDVKVIG